MKGIIPSTLNRLKAKNFSPNMEHQMMQEENERSFLEWCRKEEPRHLREDILDYDSTPWYKRLVNELRGTLP